MEEKLVVAGVDVGSEYIKAIVLNEDKVVLGRSVVAVRGYFQDRIREAMATALDDGQVKATDLARSVVTGFGASCAPFDSMVTASETACQAKGVFHTFPEKMTVIDIGGREPKVIQVDETGWRTHSTTVRKCAFGIGTLLMFTARHLDVHPTRLMELATAAERPTNISSYCSIFAETGILEKLRDGATREEIALGCLHSIAERIIEIGFLPKPLVATGGVVEFFPGIQTALQHRSGQEIRVTTEPIMSCALGAALMALETERAS